MLLGPVSLVVTVMRITNLLMHTLPVSDANVKSTDYLMSGTMLINDIVVFDTGLSSAAYHHAVQTCLSNSQSLRVCLE